MRALSLSALTVTAASLWMSSDAAGAISRVVYAPFIVDPDVLTKSAPSIPQSRSGDDDVSTTGSTSESRRHGSSYTTDELDAEDTYQVMAAMREGKRAAVDPVVVNETPSARGQAGQGGAVKGGQEVQDEDSDKQPRDEL